MSDLPVGSADILPRIAARAWPERVALRAGDRSVTFAELDRQVSRLAFGLRRLLGGDGLAVAVSATIGPAFPTAFYAVLRSGNVVVPVNPRVPAATFARVLAGTGTRAAVLGRVMYERVRGELDGLEQVVLLDTPAAAGQPTCASLAGLGILPVEPGDRAETTEAMPGISHHALKAMAAARARADGLTASSVVLNATASFDPAQLGAGLLCGATQVLWGNPDPAAALREAARVGATHVHHHGAPARAVAS